MVPYRKNGVQDERYKILFFIIFETIRWLCLLAIQCCICCSHSTKIVFFKFCLWKTLEKTTDCWNHSRISFVKVAIHLACITYDAVSAGCSPKIRRRANRSELIPIHFEYIMLFSYFCVARKDSEFCYYILSYNSFDFSRDDLSLCESYTICELRNVIQEKPAKTGLHTPFRIIAWYVKMCAIR